MYIIVMVKKNLKGPSPENFEGGYYCIEQLVLCGHYLRAGTNASSSQGNIISFHILV